MMRFGLSLAYLRINILSFIHKEQDNFPNDFLQDIAFPCQRIVTFTLLRASPMVSFVFLSSTLVWFLSILVLWTLWCCAKCLANESAVWPVFTNLHTSPRCWLMAKIRKSMVRHWYPQLFEVIIVSQLLDYCVEMRVFFGF